MRKRLWLGLGVVAAAAVAATGAFGRSSGGTITTFAGQGQYGYAGDGGPAKAAQLADPMGLAVDGKGNVYIADAGNFRVRKVRRGRITTIAGTGVEGFEGDGGQATAAQMSGPWGLALDDKGSVYFADRSNSRVRKVSPDGKITTFAGTGQPGFSGDGGRATSAQLTFPVGLAVDEKGNVYIADTLNHRVRQVSPRGKISTFAGRPRPYRGVFRGGFGGDGGPAASARLNSPNGVAVDRKGNVFIADTGNFRVRKVDRRGKITTFAGTGAPGFSGDGGPATKAKLGRPFRVAVDRDGNVYILDSDNFRVRRVSPSGTITTFAGAGTAGSSGDGGPASLAGFGSLLDVAVDRQGNVFIADSSRVREVWK